MVFLNSQHRGYYVQLSQLSPDCVCMCVCAGASVCMFVHINDVSANYLIILE